MVNIIRGADKTVNLNFEVDGAAWSLAGVTAMEVTFPGATPVSKTLAAGAITITSEVNGTAEVVLTNADTESLTLGQGLPIEIIVDKSSVRKIFTLAGELTVVDPLY